MYSNKENDFFNFTFGHALIIFVHVEACIALNFEQNGASGSYKIVLLKHVTQIAVIYVVGNPYNLLHLHRILRRESYLKCSKYKIKRCV